MNMMTSLKWVEDASQVCGTLLGKTAFCSLIGVSMGLSLGIGPDPAAAATLEQTVGPLTVDFLYPNVTTDLNLGTYNFPSQGQTVTVPFGVGIQTTVGTTIRNIFELDIAPTGFAIRYLDPVDTIGFVNNDQAIIKVTTTESSLLDVVSLQSETGITLSPGAFLYGSNFFQVNPAQASFINPGATLVFSASYNVSAPEPVPESESLPPLALSLVALALLHRAIKTNGRGMG